MVPVEAMFRGMHQTLVGKTTRYMQISEENAQHLFVNMQVSHRSVDGGLVFFMLHFGAYK